MGHEERYGHYSNITSKMRNHGLEINELCSWLNTVSCVICSFLSSHIFIWQTHNALFIICCLLKVFICEMSEEELQLHFTYEEKSPGSYSKSCLRWRSGDSVCNIKIEFEK